MDIDIIKSIVLRNRKILNELYEDYKWSKTNRKIMDENAIQDPERADIYKAHEYFYHNRVNILRKEIAKLVKIQKALKQEMREGIMLTRFAKQLRIEMGL